MTDNPAPEAADLSYLRMCAYAADRPDDGIAYVRVDLLRDAIAEIERLRRPPQGAPSQEHERLAKLMDHYAAGPFAGLSSDDFRAIAAFLRGAADGRGEAVPEGWKLVPMEPTKAMLDAYNGTHRWLESNDGTTYRVQAAYANAIGEPYWKAMLAAAPASPAQQEDDNG